MFISISHSPDQGKTGKCEMISSFLHCMTKDFAMWKKDFTLTFFSPKLPVSCPPPFPLHKMGWSTAKNAKVTASFTILWGCQLSSQAVCTQIHKWHTSTICTMVPAGRRIPVISPIFLNHVRDDLIEESKAHHYIQ